MSFNFISLLIHIELLRLSTQKKNSNSHITENTLIDVNTRELNDILRTSGYTKVNEEDDDEYDDDEIEEKEDISNSFYMQNIII